MIDRSKAYEVYICLYVCLLVLPPRPLQLLFKVFSFVSLVCKVLLSESEFVISIKLLNDNLVSQS